MSKNEKHIVEIWKEEERYALLLQLEAASKVEDDCLIYTGETRFRRIRSGHHPDQRPYVFYKGRTYPLHRLVWVLRNGLIPKGFSVARRCRNSRCVAANHMYLLPVDENGAKRLDLFGDGRSANRDSER